MELFEFGQKRLNLINRRQDCCPEVIGARPLVEPAAWHYTNTRRVDQLKAVEHVRLQVERPGVLDRLLRNLDARERVHGPFESISGH